MYTKVFPEPLTDDDVRSIAELIYAKYGDEATLSHRAIGIIHEIMVGLGRYTEEQIADNRLRVQREVLKIRREQ